MVKSKYPVIFEQNIKLFDLGRRICYGCKIEKSIDDFGTDTKSLFNLHTRCKDCNRLSAKLSKEKLRTEEENQLILLIKSGNARCTICDSVLKLGKGNYAIDHDHITDKICSLLCKNCNTGLGLFKESIILLNKAISYIILHGKQSKEELY